MSSPATVNMESMLSDFSTNLLDTKEVDKKPKKENGQMDDALSDSETMAGNFNLNSVLTKIRDNGSAYIDTRKRDIEKNNNQEKVSQSANNGVDNSMETQTQKQTSYLNEEIADDELHLSSKKTVDIKLLNYISRTQLLSLTGVTALIIGISMYMLDSHVDSSIQATVNNVNTSTPVLLLNNNEKMEGEIARSPDQIMLSEIQATDMNELTLISSNISDLKSEIHSLRKELDQVKASLTSGHDKSKTLEKVAQPTESKVVAEPVSMSITESIAKVVSEDISTPVSIQSKSAGEAIKTNSATVDKKTLAAVNQGEKLPAFMVGLVSLSNKEKANEIIEKLDMTGLSPQIKEVMVNGKPIYRITVSGFNSKQTATQFIKNAANKFGIKGSRIRKY